MKIAQRMERLTPFLFLEINKLVRQQRELGRDVIALNIGNPDLTPPPHVVDRLSEAAHSATGHLYPESTGSAELRQALADWYEQQHGVTLDRDREVEPLIGSKEAPVHLTLAIQDPGDVCLLPDPRFSNYAAGAALAGCDVYPMPLVPENSFLPDLDAIPRDVADRATALWLNYPNNPTGAVAGLDFFERVIHFGRTHDIAIVHDAPYLETVFDGYEQPSILQVPGARDVAIEINSLSKSHSMQGYRVGVAVGNERLVGALTRLKAYVDAGIPTTIQQAAIAALTGPQDASETYRQVYQRRALLVVEGLHRAGIDVPAPGGGLYVWGRIPEGFASSMDYVKFLIEEEAVVVTPGNGFGPSGEGFFRIAFTSPDERLTEAMTRIAAAHARRGIATSAPVLDA